MSSFLPKAVVGLLLIGAVIAGVVYSQQAPPEEQASDTAPSATAEAPPTEQPMAEEPTVEQPAPGVAGNVAIDPNEPIVVPEGSPEELLAFVSELEQREAQARQLGQEVYFPFLRQSKQASLQAADKVLEADAEGDTLASAIDIKLQALRTLGIMNELLEGGDDVDYWGQTVAFVDEVADRYPNQATEDVKNYKVYAHCFQTKSMTPEEAEVVVQEIKAHMLEGEIDETDVSLARTLCAMLETPGKFELAAQANLDFAKLFRDHGNAAVADMGDMFEQAAQLLAFVGTEAEISGITPDGSELDIAEYRGKVVLVDFWATWCGPCLDELPNVLRNYEAFHDQGFEVIGVSLDDSKEVIEKFLETNKLPWVTLVSDSSGGTGFNNSLAARYEVEAIPFTMLVDREGKIISVRVRGEELQRQLEVLMDATGDTASTRS